eukprot:CAMPEP_0170617608 /NCGR_PEP_ID=MMETSP0224-20130122/26512_1 /TAXON_ID=285029 /ORGANISM="Togula jolla, Strain CCCM 725" /LENGTH=99 /DNA_ID=CAMNT_0010943519 /DNA_START=424 /DNA_END=719 /DNA_ORIENTATION=-
MFCCNASPLSLFGNLPSDATSSSSGGGTKPNLPDAEGLEGLRSRLRVSEHSLVVALLRLLSDAQDLGLKFRFALSMTLSSSFLIYAGCTWPMWEASYTP